MQESTDTDISQYIANESAPATPSIAGYPSDESNGVSTDSNKEIDLISSEYYENRELSYFKFNLRVLEQAKDENHPLLERLMFLLIFSSNLDEFFEIRVSGLKKQLGFGRQRPGADGQYPEQTLKILHQQVSEALSEQYRILNEDLFPSLANEGIRFLARHEW
ncbi:MAG TPA: RNA degradosome polyphosphate kinase, partial [Gammaproteobacteria bacterium]|nr:RNA degradosome polyphosphate kinase [Gammaproteobacteria bacterium]